MKRKNTNRAQRDPKTEKRRARLKRGLGLALVILVIISSILVIRNRLEKESNYQDSLAAELAKEMSGNHLVFSGGAGRRTVVDFQEPVLRICMQKAELVVHSLKVEETVSIADEGLGGWRWTSSYQNIKYSGIVEYMIDLSTLTEADFTVNNDTKELTVRIPYVTLKPINFPAEQMEFEEIDKGWFGPKAIKMSVEQTAELEMTVERLVKTKLIDENEAVKANEDAKKVVTELLGAIVHTVDPDFSVVVVQ